MNAPAWPAIQQPGHVPRRHGSLFAAVPLREKTLKRSGSRGPSRHHSHQRWEVISSPENGASFLVRPKDIQLPPERPMSHEARTVMAR